MLVTDVVDLQWQDQQMGKETVIRNRDPLICSHSALAQYFFYRWHQSGEAPPSFKSQRDWYNTKILVGSFKDLLQYCKSEVTTC